MSVLQRLAVTDPGKLAQIAYGLLPRDVFISVEQRNRAILIQTSGRSAAGDRPQGKCQRCRARAVIGVVDLAQSRLPPLSLLLRNLKIVRASRTTMRTAKLTVAMRRNTRSATLILIIEEDLLADGFPKHIDLRPPRNCHHLLRLIAQMAVNSGTAATNRQRRDHHHLTTQPTVQPQPSIGAAFSLRTAISHFQHGRTAGDVAGTGVLPLAAVPNSPNEPPKGEPNVQGRKTTTKSSRKTTWSSTGRGRTTAKSRSIRSAPRRRTI